MSVVVGYIPTKEGRSALLHAAREARLRACDLVIVASGRSGRDSQTEPVRRFEESLSALREEFAAEGLNVVDRVQQHSKEVADDLIDVADELGAQCIVIGLRRRSPIGKLVLGSNAQRILLEAHCPVMAVKSQN